MRDSLRKNIIRARDQIVARETNSDYKYFCLKPQCTIIISKDLKESEAKSNQTHAIQLVGQ